MIANSQMREINSTTKRLVERCLGGDWCVSLRERNSNSPQSDRGLRVGSPTFSEGSTIFSPPGHMGPISIAAAQHVESSGSSKVMKSMKYSKSVENLSGRLDPPREPPLRSPLDQVRRPSNASVQSLPSAMAANFSKLNVSSNTKKRSPSHREIEASAYPQRHNSLDPDHLSLRIHVTQPPPHSPSHLHSPISPASSAPDSDFPAVPPTRRRPPPPPKRRKPPAIPVGHTNGGATITSIRSSEPSPLSKVHKPPVGVQPVS